jgi:hypothetical protein
MTSTKGELIEHYCKKEPTEFYQFDGAYLGEGDFFQRVDADGDWIGATRTWELMHGHPVRVLIHTETTPEEAVRLLRKTAAWIERQPEMLSRERRDTGCVHENCQVGGGHVDCYDCGARFCQHPANETCEEAADGHALRLPEDLLF